MSVTVGFWAVAFALGSSSLPLPQLGGATAANVPFILFAPLAPAIALNMCFGALTPVETTALRRIAALDSLLALAVVAATAAVAAPVAAGWITGVNEHTVEAMESAVRNLVCYTGLALIARAALGTQASTLLPTLVALVVSVFGYGPEQAAHWWAWPVAQPSELLSWAGSGTLLLIGLYRTAQGDFPRRS
ncbi:hypothetical protein AB0945_36190 [Streptomyces sp. NPDC005474]|uniref:hypothetical protein n=1 Tax=Streptomyces sp. NPDC005474 TaxID=3154878 RepID=UPI003452A40A